MAHIDRVRTAPISDGEGIIADDVEGEFQTIFTAIGESGSGTLDTTNFARYANILGSQFTNTTVAGGNFRDDTITTSKNAASAVIKSGFLTVDTSVAWTSSATFVDVPEVSTITLTPGSTNDIVTMFLQVSHEFAYAPVELLNYNFGFNIDDGTGDVEIGRVHHDNEPYNNNRTTTFEYTMTATAAASTVYTARYRRESGTKNPFFLGSSTEPDMDYSILFCVYITPIK